ncbi:class I adenylate-forming enzyme family protein [Blautia producta]|uniref:class I adenylate-forming enzyme family protein n=1 Tax=Blautia producta TaxID=33035 RepID=UPI00210DCD88|nr:class I adenylate-forming enzyme family protein [Blautia producta]MCQ4744254.1 acyl--CoA ligase [Blautia producta]
MKTIFEVLEHNKKLEKQAIICGKDTVSYAELYKKVVEFGNLLCTYNTDKIIVFMPNCVNYVIAYLGTLYSKKTVYPISSKSKKDEVKSAIIRTNANTILCTKETLSIAKKSIESIEANLICMDDMQTEKRDRKNKMFAEFEIEPPEVSVLLNTSGSTAIHKIVMLNEEGIMTNCRDWINEILQQYEEGRMLIAMPAATSFGTVIITTCIILGWTMVFLPAFFNSGTLIKTIEQENITHLLCIGSMLNILVKDLERVAPNEIYNTLKFIGIGGNKAVGETIKKIMRYFPNAGISPGYGITEATCIVTAINPKLSLANKKKFLEKIESAGTPFPNVKLKIGRGINGEDNIGEILISGPTVMHGYYKNDIATKEAIKDEVLYTGDIGYIDEENYLYIVGRIKNIIKSGGYTVFPEEIETVLLNCSIIKEAYVYGVKDFVLDEKIVADVVLVDENEDDKKKIKDYCMEHLADYKIPACINIVNTIQKTKTGKVYRKVHF